MTRIHYALLASLFAAPLAQASTLYCSTLPAVNGEQYTVQVASMSGNSGAVRIAQTRRLSHFIRPIDSFAVQINHLGPENASFRNESKGFELELNFASLVTNTGLSRPPYTGTATFEDQGRRVSEPVLCPQPQ